MQHYVEQNGQCKDRDGCEEKIVPLLQWPAPKSPTGGARCRRKHESHDRRDAKNRRKCDEQYEVEQEIDARPSPAPFFRQSLPAADSCF